MERKDDNDPDDGLTCAALATGMKCLPQHKIGLANGNVLHDWHAEVLAIRAFNRFLVDECADLAKRGFGHGDEARGRWLKWRKKDQNRVQPFELQDDVRIHMYCSEAPCGDASMELTMAEQEDDTPWPASSNAAAASASDAVMLGRGHFDQLGIVRRKPARPDAPSTSSKSCSDKLALKQCTGLLSGLTSTLIWPEKVFLSSFVLPESQYVSTAMERSFGTGGRMKDVAAQKIPASWQNAGYAFRPFEIKTTNLEFECSKRSSTAPVPSNLSALCTPSKQEILINGVLQGRKQFDPQGASCVSRRSMWSALLDVAKAVGDEELWLAVVKEEYGDVKAGEVLRAREDVKKHVRDLALKAWKKNTGDDEFALS